MLTLDSHYVSSVFAASNFGLNPEFGFLYMFLGPNPTRSTTRLDLVLGKLDYI